MPVQPDLFSKPKRPHVFRAHIVDANNGYGPGQFAVFECQRCGWKSEWMRIRGIVEGKRGVPCPNCNKT